MMDYTQYDTILILDQVLEAKVSNQPETYGIFKGVNPNSQYGFGAQVAAMLRNSEGYSVETTDFGSDIVVRVSYSDPLSARHAGMNFLIKLASKKGDGIIKSSSYRWRSIGDVGQAVSYIKSRMGTAKQQAGVQNN